MFDPWFHALFLHLAVVTKADGHKLGGQCKYLPLDPLPELLSKCNVKENCVSLLPTQWAHLLTCQHFRSWWRNSTLKLEARRGFCLLGVAEIFYFTFFISFPSASPLSSAPLKACNYECHICCYWLCK